MKSYQTLSVLIVLLLGFTSCSTGDLESTASGGVILSISDFDGLPVLVGVNGTVAVGGLVQVGEITIENIAKDPTGVTSDLMSVEINSYEVSYSRADMELAGQHCSDLSRRAEEASRQVEQALKCDHMQDRVGEEFEAHITGVTDFGLFVSVEGTGVEGLVHVSTLGDDYYRFEPETRSLVGDNSGKRYRLCDPIRVRCVEVRPDERKIDFEAVSGPKLPETGRGRARGKRRG